MRIVSVDWQLYFSQRLSARSTNAAGFLSFDCPMCNDKKHRGWVNVQRGAAGCFNAGCPAEPKLKHGAIELAAFIERKPIGVVLLKLQDAYPYDGVLLPEPVHPAYEEKCKLPPNTPIGEEQDREPLRFLKRQWGVSRELAEQFDVRWCTEGRFAWRLIFPFYEVGEIVGFQGRSTRNSIRKYRAHEVAKDGGYPLHELLYGLDRVHLGERVVVVEGAGDVMALAKRGIAAVALCGVTMAAEQAAKLKDRDPSDVVVALDNDTAVLDAWKVISVCLAHGLRPRIAVWKGGKDAGAGARLRIGRILNAASSSDLMAARLTR